MSAAEHNQAGVELPPFAPFLIQSLRSLGYSLQSALADIIDNSLAANASKVAIEFMVTPSPRLVVLDDGRGMSERALVEAMRFGSADPRAERASTDLGRFGLGMKTASLSQCRRLTVVTARNQTLTAARWDIDESERRGTWWLVRPKVSELPAEICNRLSQLEHGTAIIWESLDRLTAGGREDQKPSVERAVLDAADHLALVFHRYLSGEMGRSFEITLNGRPLPQMDPFLAGHIRGQTLHGETFDVDGIPVQVSPFVLPFPSRLREEEVLRAGGKESLKTGHGFYIYRAGRLVVPGGWFRMVPTDQLARLARVRVDIPVALDHIWKVDIRKATAEPPPILREHLKRIVGAVTERSRRVYTFKGAVGRGAEHLPMWLRHDGRDGAATWRVNRSHPIAAAALRPAPNLSDVDRLLRLLEEGIPAHEIHIHISNDQPVAAPPAYDAVELEAMLLRLVDAFRDSPEMLRAVLDRLPMTEPFSRDPEKARELADKVRP